MPLADTFARAYQVRGQMEQMEERRRKRESDQSISDLYSSGQPVDQGSIQKLLAGGADPASVLSISKMLRGQGVDEARVANLESQMKVRESPMVAGALKTAFDAWKAKPPEAQTQVEWEKWKATGRKQLASNGMDPNLVPADADPGFIEAQIGAGYAPDKQDLTMDRRDENVARQGRFELGEQNENARYAMGEQNENTRSALSRAAADARDVRRGSRPAGPSQLDRTLEQLGIKAGTPEYVKAKRVEANLEPGPASEGRRDTSLRKEFNTLPVVKQYGAIVPVVQSAREAVTTDTPAADMNLVYAAAKVMDPDSVVRESETAMVVDTGSPAEKFMGTFNYVAGGGRLTAETRQQLMDEIESRAKGYEGIYNESVKQYKTGAPPIGSLPAIGAGRGRSAQQAAPADDPNRQLTPEEMEEYMARKGGRR